MKKNKYKMFFKALIIVFIVLIIAIYFIDKTKQTEPEAPFQKQESWNEIVPGFSTMDNVIETLGEPQETLKTDVSTVHLYPSTNSYYLDEIETLEETVNFIKIMAFSSANRSLKEKFNKDGNDYTKLFGPNSNSGVFLFAYPEYGIAFLGNPIGDLIMETWYFPQTTLEELLELPQLEEYSQTEFQRLDV